MKTTDFGVHDALIPEKFESEVGIQPQLYGARINFLSRQLFIVGLVALAFCGIIVIVVVTQESKADDTPDSLSVHPAGGTIGSCLYDLSVDSIEYTNLIDNPNYASVYQTLYSKATSWKSIYNDPWIPSNDGKDDAFESAGGVVPWITTNNTARDITQLYSYNNAPHIVFFLVDDWGYNDVGYQSTYLNWTTPNIDALMRGGIRLSNYHTHELCCPTRAALLTGRYASRFGMNGNNAMINLPLSEVTLAEELHSAGYRNYMVGKWHQGASEWALTPTYRGFDYFYGYYAAFIDYWSKQDGAFLDLHENTALVTDPEALSPHMHSAYLYESKAEAIIAQHAVEYPDTPMFLYYASQLIHDKWEAPKQFVDRCIGGTVDQKTYCGMNLMLDEAVGNLTCALKANGLFDNTVFILVSDNGGANQMAGSSQPWRGGKGSMWRGGSTANGFIYGSSNIIPSSRVGDEYSGLMHVTDWLPTLLGLATDNAWSGSYSGATLDGYDQWSSIIGNTESPRPEILHFLQGAGNVSYQLGTDKLILQGSKMGLYGTPVQVYHGTTSSEVCLV